MAAIYAGTGLLQPDFEGRLRGLLDALIAGFRTARDPAEVLVGPGEGLQAGPRFCGGRDQRVLGEQPLEIDVGDRDAGEAHDVDHLLRDQAVADRRRVHAVE